MKTDIQSRIDHYRHEDDRLRKFPRKSRDTLQGVDLSWWSASVVNYGDPLPSHDECWIWRGGFSDSGQPIFILATGRQIGAHRAAFATWIRPLKDDDVIRHACGDYRCVNPAHLANRKYGHPDELTDYRRPPTGIRRIEGKDDFVPLPPAPDRLGIASYSATEA